MIFGFAILAVLFLAVGVVIFNVLLPSQDWTEVKFNNLLTFRSPVALSKTPDQGIDSSFALWKGEGITVHIDYGLFCDPLTSYTNRPNYKLRMEEINGYAARIVSFEKLDGSHFAAVHFPDLRKLGGGDVKKLTMVVEASQTMGKEIPFKIIRSIKFTDRKEGSPKSSSSGGRND